jgi:hypothetical protein
VRSETKILNLETHEFGSNPPLKKMSRHFHFVLQLWWEQKFKKILAGNVSFFLAGAEAFKK